MNYFQLWHIEKLALISEAQVKASNSQGKSRIKAILDFETLKSQLKILETLSINYSINE